MIPNDPIIALATPSGAGAIAVIRISGQDAIALANNFFRSIKSKDLNSQKSHTIHLGHIVDEERILDEVSQKTPIFISVSKNKIRWIQRLNHFPSKFISPFWNTVSKLDGRLGKCIVNSAADLQYTYYVFSFFFFFLRRVFPLVPLDIFPRFVRISPFPMKSPP